MDNRATLATLCYIYNDDKILLLQRNKKDKETDIHQADGIAKYIGVGGKIEPLETPRAGIIREVQEEVNITVEPLFRGIMYFIDVRTAANSKIVTANTAKKQQYEKHWIIFIYTAQLPNDAQIPKTSPEGTLHWIPKENIFSDNPPPMWSGDYLFLEKLLKTDETLEICHKYVDGRLVGQDI